MLDKGSYIDDTLTVPDGILRRTEEHHLYKKNTLLRTLRSWDPPRDVT